jgi:single-strand DNA-binding protein
MASLNKVQIIGNCGRSPEIRYLPSGMAICDISIATSSKRKDKNSGETIEETQWHRVKFFDKLAQIVGEYVRKGSPVYVEGRLTYGKFTNKDGQEVNTADIIADSMQMLGGKPQGQESTQRPAPRQEAPRQAAPRPSSGFDDMDDDIPF